MPSNSTEYSKKYYATHRDKYVDKDKTCDICKCTFKGHMKRHLNSKKHIKNVIIS